MRYVRIFVDAADSIVSVQEQNAPFVGAGSLRDDGAEPFCVGAVRDEDVPVTGGFARWLHDRLVFDRITKTAHFNGAADAVEILPTPTTLEKLKETLGENGRSHGLPAEVAADMKARLLATDKADVKLLHAVGLPLAEIKQHQYFAAKRDQRSRERQQADERARAAKAAAEIEAARQARIDRKLNRGTT
jgi:hypothetical protein